MTEYRRHSAVSTKTFDESGDLAAYTLIRFLINTASQYRFIPVDVEILDRVDQVLKEVDDPTDLLAVGIETTARQ
jgi:hypothetical protein